jgi:uncharacterized membrane protein YcaP (DUF421 family)
MQMTGLNAFAETILGLSAQPRDLSMAQICVRACVVYVALLAFVRFGKKRFLGGATAFDTVLVILIGSMAARAITGNAAFFGTLAAIYVLIVLHWFISLISRDWPSFSYLVKGQPTVLIHKGRLDRAALRQAHMSDDDLDEDLRQEGIDNPGGVKEARLERSGKISVVRNE